MKEMKLHISGALGLALLVLPTLVLAQNPSIQSDTPAPLETEDETLIKYTLPDPPVQMIREHVSEKSKAPDPIVESASHLRLALSEVASSVEIITAEDLRASKAASLPEALRGALGVDLVQNGGPGQLSTIILRGAGTERTRVMLNGMPITDAMAPARLADISKVSLAQVERIEIVKGPQSVTHGSGALGGIINIVTAKPSEDWQGEVTAEGGSFDSFFGQVQTSGTEAGVGVAFGAALENTRGYSAAKRSPDFTSPQPIPAMDRDGFRNLTLDLSLDGHPAEGLELCLTNRYLRTDSELDVFAGDFGDDPNYLGRFDQLIQNLRVDWDTLPKIWEQTFRFGWNRIERAYDNPTDTDHPVDRFQGNYTTRLLEGDWQHHFQAGERNRLVVGVGYQEEAGTYTEQSAYLDWWTGLPATSETQFGPVSAHLVSLYTEGHLQWQAFTTTLGVRYDQHDQFGGFTTYRVTPAYSFDAWHTRLKGSWGTGFNAPTLFQLYANDAFSQGNPELQPEVSTGWDLGVEQSWFEDRLQGGVTYFQTGYQDQISATFDPVTFLYTYENLDQVNTSGWEAMLRVEPLDDLTVRVNYTKLTANETDPNGVPGTQPLRLRADFQASGEVRYRWRHITAQLKATHIGPRWDTGHILLAPYTLVDATVNYEYRKLGEVYLKLRNVFDTRYEVVSGYTAAPFAAYAGVTLRWM